MRRSEVSPWPRSGLPPKRWLRTIANDATYSSIEGQIQSLTAQRDSLAAQMIGLLNGAEFNGQSFSDRQAQSLIAQGQALLDQANSLPQ